MGRIEEGSQEVIRGDVEVLADGEEEGVEGESACHAERVAGRGGEVEEADGAVGQRRRIA